MESIKKLNVDHFVTLKETIITGVVMIIISIGSKWVWLISNDVIVKSLSVISIALIIIVNLFKIIDYIQKKLKSKNTSHERKEEEAI
jgi:tetrahydromethanopterin S-methyltransferase subunit E